MNIGFLIVRLLRSRELIYNQKLFFFLRKNKIKSLIYDLKGQIDLLDKIWYTSLKFLALLDWSYKLNHRIFAYFLLIWQVDCWYQCILVVLYWNQVKDLNEVGIILRRSITYKKRTFLYWLFTITALTKSW